MGELERGVDDAKAIFRAAVRAVQADVLLSGVNWDRLARRPLESYSRLFVVGMGKASLAMASVVESALSDLVAGGCVVVPHGYLETLPDRFEIPGRIEVITGGHPVPDEGSVRAAREVLGIAEAAGKDDLVMVLVSGGGSALCIDFLGDISLEDAASTFTLLLESGAGIHALNAVRKHISRVGGGRLAVTASPAEVLALTISDVIGDDLSVVASGPTTGDSSTFGDARSILEDFHLWKRVPIRVRDVIEYGLNDSRLETPKPGDAVFDRVSTSLIGSNASALDAARVEARLRGYDAEVITTSLAGEARDVGRRLGESAVSAAGCLLYGGETTVTVQGPGKGGRNQEAALAAALALDNVKADVVFLSGGTDGIDGPTDAAGAWASPRTVSEGLAAGIDAAESLARNDSYTYFSRTGGLLRTGATHTNVGDVVVVLRRV